MSSDSFDFLSREELLEGRVAPGRKANTLLFAIECRTAQLVSQSKQATALYLTKKAVEERERAFLEAMAAGRDLPVQPTIQDLERYAPQWTDLVSEADVNLRAALAQAIAKKYVLARDSVPNIRAALGLDQADVQQAYERLYGEGLSSIYAGKVTPGARIRWALSRLASRLEGLPPFWVAFALTLPVGPGLLAIPIAVADVGAVAAIVLLVIFGAINALTAAALAETVARSGTMRFGLGYLGQLISEYLGNAGSLLLTSIMAIDNLLVMIVFYIGVAGTLQGATGLPSALWVAALFAIGLYFLSRKSLNSTVASALVVTTINVLLLIIIPLFALPYIQPANLAYARIPFIGGQPFDPGVLRLIFGVMLSNFFSHMLVANYGRVIIRRDTSARSWIWGAVASIGMTTLISCLWVLCFNGAIAPDALARESGTALTALQARVGPIVTWLGSVFVVLSLGMASIHVSLALLFMMEERLPSSSKGWLSGRARFLISISPVAGVFVVSEWLAITGQGSFSELLGFVGVIALPLLGGIFPILLLAATRRKGDYVPGLVLKLLGNPIVLGATYVLFLGSIFVYGLFIYQGLVERVVTLLVGTAVLVVTVIMLRRGALNKRVVVELCQELGRAPRQVVRFLAGGKPATADVTLDYGNRSEHKQEVTGEVYGAEMIRCITVQLPATPANELKVWTHRLSPEWASQVLPARLRLSGSGKTQEFDLQATGGQVMLPWHGESSNIEIILPDERAI